MKLSILTATYNRGKLLERLYKSIENNLIEEMEIEWLIMDDGSTDNTKEIIESFKKEAKFKIEYYKQENQGKMVAINNLVEKSNGHLIVECDSDDYFKNNSFKMICDNYNEMNGSIYALCYLKYNQNECNIGNLFKEKETKMFDLYFKQGENGEKALVYNADIRKKIKYELENNERFITEARLHHKMDKEYNIICFNEPIMICEYQENGYTKNIMDMFKKYPYGYFEYFKEIFEMDMKNVTISKRIYALKHYILFSVLVNKKFKEALDLMQGKLNKALFTILYLPGKLVTKMKFKD